MNQSYFNGMENDGPASAGAGGGREGRGCSAGGRADGEVKMAEMTLIDETKAKIAKAMPDMTPEERGVCSMLMSATKEHPITARQIAESLGWSTGQTVPLQAHLDDLVDRVVEDFDDPRPLADELHDFLFEHLREHLPITNAQQLLELLAKMPDLH